MSKKLIIILLFLPFFLSCDLLKNFHVVDSGKLMRSAQLDAKGFEGIIKAYGIKTIINLRGENLSTDWYKDEIEVSARYGVHHEDIGMSAKRLPHREDLIKLLDLFASAERPILIHCQGGADRTGEASAIYQMLYMNKSKKEALKMLTLKYFHLAKKMPAKRYFIKELWQGEDWARNEYDPCAGQYRYYDSSTGHCQGELEVLSADDDT